MTCDRVITKDTWKRKRKNYEDSASTDGAIEGCTNRVSRAT